MESHEQERRIAYIQGFLAAQGAHIDIDSKNKLTIEATIGNEDELWGFIEDLANNYRAYDLAKVDIAIKVKFDSNFTEINIEEEILDNFHLLALIALINKLGEDKQKLSYLSLEKCSFPNYSGTTITTTMALFNAILFYKGEIKFLNLDAVTFQDSPKTNYITPATLLFLFLDKDKNIAKSRLSSISLGYNRGVNIASANVLGLFTALPNLTYLSLIETDITDDFLKSLGNSLAKSHNLQSLLLGAYSRNDSDIWITEVGINYLANALREPSCQIEKLDICSLLKLQEIINRAIIERKSGLTQLYETEREKLPVKKRIMDKLGLDEPQLKKSKMNSKELVDPDAPGPSSSIEEANYEENSRVALNRLSQ